MSSITSGETKLYFDSLSNSIYRVLQLDSFSVPEMKIPKLSILFGYKELRAVQLGI